MKVRRQQQQKQKQTKTKTTANFVLWLFVEHKGDPESESLR